MRTCILIILLTRSMGLPPKRQKRHKNDTKTSKTTQKRQKNVKNALAPRASLHYIVIYSEDNEDSYPHYPPYSLPLAPTRSMGRKKNLEIRVGGTFEISFDKNAGKRKTF